MNTHLTIRCATPGDEAAVSRVLAASYGALLSGHYPPEVLATAVPAMSGAQPGLLASGRYYIALDGETPAAVGGWSPEAPGLDGVVEPGIGHVRHVACHPDHTRRGAARAIMERVFDEADAAGCRTLECLSTLAAVPFYQAMGFRRIAEESLPLGQGLPFTVVLMRR